jgi:hypothetical protein
MIRPATSADTTNATATLTRTPTARARVIETANAVSRSSANPAIIPDPGTMSAMWPAKKVGAVTEATAANVRAPDNTTAR